MKIKGRYIRSPWTAGTSVNLETLAQLFRMNAGATDSTDTDTRSKRARERETMADPILSVSRAAELLPIDDARAARWLRSHGLVFDLDGKPVVSWSAVHAHLLREGQAQKEEPAPTYMQPTKMYPKADLTDLLQ